MAKQPIFEADADNFLLWCKSTCDQQTQSNILLDLEAVGHFFTQKMADGDLEVESLSITGFDLLQSYFLSSNEQTNKIKRIEQREVQQRGQMMN
jgi:hypothetical protein